MSASGPRRASRSVSLYRALRRARRRRRSLRLQTVEIGRLALLRISGPVDSETTPVLSEAVQPWRRRGQRLILDLRAADSLKSAGLRLLIELGGELETGGGEVRLLLQRGSRVERAVQLARMDRRFAVFHSAPEAWVGRCLTSADLAIAPV